MVQSLSCVWLFTTPWTAAYRTRLSLNVSQSLLKFMSIESWTWWCHPTISSSVSPFSFCLPSFPASWSFPVSQFFASSMEVFGASALAWVLPVNIHGWFLLGLTGMISLQSKGLSRVFSSKGLLQEGEHFDQICKHLNRQKKALLLRKLVSP